MKYLAVLVALLLVGNYAYHFLTSRPKPHEPEDPDPFQL